MRIMLFGKTIASIYRHHIMKADNGHLADLRNFDINLFKLNMESEDLDAVAELTSMSMHNFKKNVCANPGLCEVFVARDSDSGDLLGMVCVMYRGGNELRYKIRNIDAYIWGVFVKEKYRGNGYAGAMICKLGDYLRGKNISTAFLAVDQKNESAINAYQKIGFRVTDERKFLRVLKHNIPYHVL